MNITSTPRPTYDAAAHAEENKAGEHVVGGNGG